MANLQLTDEINIKQAFESINLPEVEVSDSVINSIKNSKHHNPKKKRAFAVGLIAAVLLLSTTAFATAHVWILKDSNNNIVLKLKEPDEENQIPPDSSTDQEFNNLIDELEPGKAIIYYDANQPKPENPNTSETLTTYSKPVKYTDLATLKTEAGIYFAIPSKLPEGYAFSEGEISFETIQFDHYNILNKLKEETMSSGKNVAAEELGTSSKARMVGIVYKNNKDEEFRVTIFILDGEVLYTDSSRYSKAEKIILNDREILYSDENELKEIMMRELQPGGQRIIKTIKDGKETEMETVINSYIHYSITSTDLAKEELLEVVGSMIP